MLTLTVSSHRSALLNLQNLFSRQALRRLVRQTLPGAEAGETLPVLTQASITRPAKSPAVGRKHPPKRLAAKLSISSGPPRRAGGRFSRKTVHSPCSRRAACERFVVGVFKGSESSLVHLYNAARALHLPFQAPLLGTRQNRHHSDTFRAAIDVSAV